MGPLPLGEDARGKGRVDEMGDLSLVAPTVDVSRVAFSFARGGKASGLLKQVVFSSPTFVVLGCSRGGKNLPRTQEHGWVVQSFHCSPWDIWDLREGDTPVENPFCLDTPNAAHQAHHHLYKAMDLGEAVFCSAP